MEKFALTLPNTDLSGTEFEVIGPSGVPTKSDVILNIPQFLITVIVTLGIVLCIVFILISGIQWILSGGDSKQIENARKRLTYSIIGLVVIIASFFIVSTVYKLLGIEDKFFNVPAVNTIQKNIIDGKIYCDPSTDPKCG